MAWMSTAHHSVFSPKVGNGISKTPITGGPSVALHGSGALTAPLAKRAVLAVEPKRSTPTTEITPTAWGQQFGLHRRSWIALRAQAHGNWIS